MANLIDELKVRHDIAQSKYCADFLYSLCDYIDLLAMHPVLNKLLLENRMFPKDDFQNIWEPYQTLLLEVYEPIRSAPELAKKRFSSFFWLDEMDRRPFMLLANPKGWKAAWKKYVYKNRLAKIHERVLILLKNKEFFETPEPVQALQASQVKESRPRYRKIKPPHYDADSGCLYVMDFKIQIKRQAKDTYEHQILKHIFVDNEDDIEQEFDYSSIPFDHFELEEKENLWSRCRTACLAINRKVYDDTDKKVDNFLIFNTRKNGWLNINPKYLDT
jgi:hypothetical protein